MKDTEKNCRSSTLLASSTNLQTCASKHHPDALRTHVQAKNGSINKPIIRTHAHMFNKRGRLWQIQIPNTVCANFPEPCWFQRITLMLFYWIIRSNIRWDANRRCLKIDWNMLTPSTSILLRLPFPTAILFPLPSWKLCETWDFHCVAPRRGIKPGNFVTIWLGFQYIP